MRLRLASTLTFTAPTKKQYPMAFKLRVKFSWNSIYLNFQDNDFA